MKKNNIFIKKSQFPAPVEKLFDWHTHPGALERLTPPWEQMTVLRKTGGIEDGARTDFKIKAGPIPIRWSAHHQGFERNRFFQDVQIEGPFQTWKHSHIFEPKDALNAFMEDHIEFSLPVYPFGSFFADGFVRQKLARMFDYRHYTLKNDLIWAKKGDKKHNIVISGASGLIGKSLLPFLTTQGHNVKQLVRSKNKLTPDTVFWDPLACEIDSCFDHIDAVIHLAGEPIGEGRWTKAKKKRIYDSRIKGTQFIAESLAAMDSPPPVLICASAIGFYGNRGQKELSEIDGPGDDFISHVCSDWEKAAQPAIDKGIRVVFLRIGVVLTPRGGALERLLLPGQLGLGAKFGNGSQYMSWISMDDAIYALYFTLLEPNIHGPVNLVAPNPVTNLALTKTIGKVLKRPAPFTIPASIIKSAFPQMGEEVLLASARVLPTALEKYGFKFQFPFLEDALNHSLGRKPTLK